MTATRMFEDLFKRASQSVKEDLDNEPDEVAWEDDPPEIFDKEEDAVQVSELVECLMEGNVMGVEQYLNSLPENRRELVRQEVLDSFEEKMKARGIQPVTVNTGVTFGMDSPGPRRKKVVLGRI